MKFIFNVKKYRFSFRETGSVLYIIIFIYSLTRPTDIHLHTLSAYKEGNRFSFYFYTPRNYIYTIVSIWRRWFFFYFFASVVFVLRCLINITYFPNLLSLNTIKNVQNKPTHRNNLVFDYKITTAVVIWIG